MPRLNEFDVYRVGLCRLSICVPKDATRKQVEDAANSEHPTGISSRWQVAKAETFKTGDPNPCPCDKHPADRLHYLMEC